jgi:hypothetical protein
VDSHANRDDDDAPLFLLSPHELLWPDPRRGPWLLTPTFGTVAGRVEVVGLQVRSLGADQDDRRRMLPRVDPPLDEGLPLPLTPEVWRLPVARLTAQMRASWMRALEGSGAFTGNPEAERKWTRPPRRSGIDLERVAEVYLQAVASGGKPLEAVRRLGPMSKSAAAQQVSRACDAGLLVRRGRGRPAGPPEPGGGDEGPA